MAKGTLEYDLTDPDDRMEFERANKSLDMALALWEFGYNTRKDIERSISEEDKCSDEQYELIDKVYEKFWEILKDRNIVIDDLIS
jgi:hypothetical protein